MHTKRDTSLSSLIGEVRSANGEGEVGLKHSYYIMGVKLRISIAYAVSRKNMLLSCNN